MPTGYTNDIKDGITFEKFILDCARAFGATVTMRDDSKDKPIPDEFEPSDYHLKELSKLKVELENVQNMSVEQAISEGKAEYHKEREYNEQKVKELDELRSKYNSMLLKAEKWKPPTLDHYGLKNFMVKQITESIDFDCNTDYHKKPISLTVGKAWLSNKKQKLLKDIDYHTKQNQEEVERVKGRNKWVKQLRDSI